jgi:Lar family restriction alleviation protein
MTDLLPCPFCAKEAVAIYDSFLQRWVVSCCNCAAQGPVQQFVTRKEAAAKWNERVSEHTENK